MGRLIDADALMETINRHCYPVQHDMTSIEPGMTRIGILQAIQEQPTIEPEQRWIPCSERLPEPDEEVFVYLWDNVPYIASMNGEGQWDTEYFCVDVKDAPKAWMPLPEPYQEGADE